MLLGRRATVHWIRRQQQRYQPKHPIFSIPYSSSCKDTLGTRQRVWGTWRLHSHSAATATSPQSIAPISSIDDALPETTFNDEFLSEPDFHLQEVHKIQDPVTHTGPTIHEEPLENLAVTHDDPAKDLPDYIACTVPRSSDAPMYVPSSENIQLSSQPTGGNWDPAAPLKWSQNFGRRSIEMARHLAPLVKLKPGDEGYFDVSNTPLPENVTVVRTVEHAQKVLERLQAAPPDLFHACDTEVMEINVKAEGPVGNGYVTCVSIHSGPDFVYDDDSPPGNTLWIDNLDDAAGVLQVFKPWFENENHKKVFHNYGFDRHVLWNEGINCRGLGGDTMHMARLQDTSRAKGNTNATGYSLEALTAALCDRRKEPMKELFGVPRLRKDGTPGSISDIPPVEVLQRDPTHRSKWIDYSAYDAKGTWLLREKLEEMLGEMNWRTEYEEDKNGVCVGTELFMNKYYHDYMRDFASVLTDMERRGIRVNAQDYLAGVEVQARKDRAHHVRVFSEWAAKQMEAKSPKDGRAHGLALNIASSVQLATFLFGGAVNPKTKDKSETERIFKVPREELSPEALEAFDALDKKQHDETGQDDWDEKELGPPPEKDDFDHMTAVQLKELCREAKLKISGKKADLQQRLRDFYLSRADNNDNKNNDSDPNEVAKMSDDDLRKAISSRGLNVGPKTTRKKMEKLYREDCEFTGELMMSSASNIGYSGYEAISRELEKMAHTSENVKTILDEARQKATEAPRFINVKITSIGMKPEKYTVGGSPSVTADVIRKLAGDPFGDKPKYGSAYKFFGKGEKGEEACKALYSLGAVGSIDTMIANFLTSLQSLADGQSRVHCSINLNTETGRLSSRRPNLQNQPALEKDKYKIRKAFEASPGNNLIVADYGQLELRILASMTECTSMIEAFESGGDFHSRTALDMFDHVQKSVKDGECLLEWDYSKGDPPKPLLKDLFASERRKAKTLNFSIAYGKTAHGLSQDWGVKKEEAEDMLKKWYKARPEVDQWQKKVKKNALKNGVTRTLMRRYRHLKRGMGKMRGQIERASINTPIQGGAADVVMMAMIKMNQSERLKRLGWILLMQIHDEVILEGPEETAQEAFEEVLQCMQEPWVPGLAETSVPLLVDGSHVNKNWYDAK